MSYTKEITIWCDEVDCLEWATYGSGRVDEARIDARADGWTHRNGKDFCPSCTWKEGEQR